MRLAIALLLAGVVAPAFAEDVAAPESPSTSVAAPSIASPAAPTFRDFTKEPSWCKADRKGNRPIKPNCPFDPKMKFASDGPYEIKQLPAPVTSMLGTQVSALLNICDDPIDKMYGVLTRYHGATLVATRRGILLEAQKMHPLRLKDYMDPSKKWEKLDENAYTCESIERAKKTAASEQSKSD
jgi:hypothetical protein